MSSHEAIRGVTVIAPTRGWRALDLREVWERREVLYFLAWRDIRVRYKQTLLGLLWALAGPLANMIIFTFIFGRVANLPSDGLPSPVFYLSGIVIWRYFSNTLSSASNSLVGNRNQLTKVYYPRLVHPLASCLTGLVDFGIAFLLLFAILGTYGLWPPPVALAIIPAMLVLAMLCALGTGLILSALNVIYRDVAQLLPFLIQLWMWITIVLPFSALPEDWGAWRWLYGLNPMASVVELFRWGLTHPHMTDPYAPWLLLAPGVPATLVALAAGLFLFKRMERIFADVI